MNQSINRTLFY